MSWTAEWTKGDRAECRMGSNGVEVWCPGTVVRVGETAVVVALDANPSLEIVQGSRYWVTGSGGMTGDIRRPEPVPVAAAIPVDLNVDVALLNVAVDIASGQRWVFCDNGEEMGPENDSIVAWLSGPTDRPPAVIVAHARPDDPALVRWDRSTFLAKHRRQRRPEELEDAATVSQPIEVAERVEGHCAAQMARLTDSRFERLSQSCQPMWNARSPASTPVLASRSSSPASRCRPRWRESAVRRMPTSFHMQSYSASRIASRSPAGRRKGFSARWMASATALPSGSRSTPSWRTHCAIRSPAMPPNTVELATPLPPRRFAP